MRFAGATPYMRAEYPASRDQSAVAPSPYGAHEEQMRAVIQQLRVVYRAMQEHSRWVEKQCGVSAAQLWALAELSQQPGLCVSELSQVLALHQSTTSNLLDKLEKKGLVERRRGGPDQRVVQVYLSAAGADSVARAPRPVQGAISAALARLPETELAGLERGLAELIGRVEGADPEAALRDLTEG